MGERGKAGSDPVEVKIFGRTYLLRSDGESSERLGRLAKLVDAKMREVADSTSTGDTLKVAIMAALNIADDYLDARQPSRPGAAPPDDVEQRLDRLVTLLDEALAG